MESYLVCGLSGVVKVYDDFRDIKVILQNGRNYKPAQTVILKGQWLVEMRKRNITVCGRHGQMPVPRKRHSRFWKMRRSVWMRILGVLCRCFTLNIRKKMDTMIGARALRRTIYIMSSDVISYLLSTK